MSFLFVAIWLTHILFSTDLNVTITIQYSPPSGVTLRPPNYRPATSVSLRCDATGTNGNVTYRWSSTCVGGCFVNGSSQTISRSYLFSYDAGYHTCVVTDGAGNTGTATTVMNIIGKHHQYYSSFVCLIFYGIST